jgi:hypothetical protein
MAIDVKTILQSYLDGPQGATGFIGATGPQGNQGATGLLSSAIYEPLNLYPSGSVSGAANSIRFYESTPNGTNYVGFRGADNISGNVTWVLPSGDGTFNQTILTNSSGVLSWGSSVLTTTNQSIAGVKTFTDSLDLMVETLTDAPTINVDAATGNKFHIVLGGNRTIANPTNPVDGRVILFRLQQDGTGNRTIAWDSKYRFRGDLATIAISTVANIIDRIAFEYVSGDDYWDCISFMRGS